jgi:hypothetical protein
VLDLGAARAVADPRLDLRTILVERRTAAGSPRDRFAIVSSLLDDSEAAIVRIAACQARIRDFFGHARWPLGDGKMPSSDPRGNAAYLRLATIATNVLRLFARQMGDEWTLGRLREDLRLIPAGQSV